MIKQESNKIHHHVLSYVHKLNYDLSCKLDLLKFSQSLHQSENVVVVGIHIV